jgi:hypothetical protein
MPPFSVMPWLHGREQTLADLLKQDPEISGHLDPRTIDGLFDTAYHLKYVDTIFRLSLASDRPRERRME